MMVTTGYTGHGAQHFADQALVYDLRCDTWHRPDLKGIFLFHVIRRVPSIDFF